MSPLPPMPQKADIKLSASAPVQVIQHHMNIPLLPPAQAHDQQAFDHIFIHEIKMPEEKTNSKQRSSEKWTAFYQPWVCRFVHYAGHMVELEEKYFFIMKIVDALTDESKCQVQGTASTKSHSSRHDNDVSPVEKLANLKWEHLGIIQSLPMSETNFEVAWKLLMDCYENKWRHNFRLLQIPLRHLSRCIDC
ncbi:hypothetical protein PR048_004158 [Dryococelus australis]|uniref:Uncharacterized protein n=1 Tax=Dryococelus australis TaxID=614101 RepID=A0ABQ9I4P9_9NEOP|nr:hypothetical protein PR048_004158 [Dryococelus australis]